MFSKIKLSIFWNKNIQTTAAAELWLCCCIGRRSVSREDAEDEQFTAILTLMEILTNLLSKDFLSFAEGMILLSFIYL